MKKLYILILLSLTTTSFFAQIGINTTDPKALLEIKSSSETAPTITDGLLIPKVNVFPATNPTIDQQGMLVYLKNTSGTNQPGFYYWNFGTLAWIPVAGTSGGTLDQAYDFGGAGLGKTITADVGSILINGTDGLVSTGTLNSGVVVPSGGGTRMVWNPRKGAFRAGTVSISDWNEVNIGLNSIAFGFDTVASGSQATAFGLANTASGNSATVFGGANTASGQFATAFGNGAISSGVAATAFGVSNIASASGATAFGFNNTASGSFTTAFGNNNTASGSHSTTFGNNNLAPSYGETIVGIGATTYFPSSGGNSQFRAANATDRLFVVGNAIDANNNSLVDGSERSDALIILKNGLTSLPSTTNAMITAADGKAIVTKEYLQSNTSGTLDLAYDFGGAGLGKTITADAGAVLIDGTDGLVSTGTLNTGAIVPSGSGIRMVWNPRKAAFRAGRVIGTQWDDANVGIYSIAFGFGSTASGIYSAVFGTNNTASGEYSAVFGANNTASGEGSTAFGINNTVSGNFSTAFGQSHTASGVFSTAFGQNNTAIAFASTSFGYKNNAKSLGETVFGIGATNYVPSIGGATQFRTANATDRLFVIGNAIDANNNDTVDTAERSDALVILKNGNTGIGSSTPAEALHVVGKIRMVDGSQAAGRVLTCDANGTAVWNTFSATNAWGLGGNAGTTSAVNFIGTSDDVDVVFRRNNNIAGLIGVNNTSFGRLALGSITTGVNNTAIGTSALSNNTVGSNNTSNGNGALSSNTTGSNNTTVGFSADVAVNNLTNATAIGSNAEVGASNSLVLGSVSGVNGATSSVNVGIGTITPDRKLEVSGPAGLVATRITNTSTTGATSNVALEFFRATNANTDWQIYNIGPFLTIGNSLDDLATVNELYQFQGVRFMPMTDATINLGQSANRWNTLFASNGTINTSDEREKKNIQNINYGLEDLLKLRPVSFEWKKEDGSGTKLGLIAQELQKVIPEVVRDWDWQEDEKGNPSKIPASTLGVYYSDLIPVLIKSIQEQQSIIDTQKIQLEAQAKTITTILNRLSTLENN